MECFDTEGVEMTPSVYREGTALISWLPGGKTALINLDPITITVGQYSCLDVCVCVCYVRNAMTA